MTKATRAFNWGLAFLLISTFVYGHNEALGSDEWEIQVTPYFFAPAADLDATVAGSTVGIDMSFSDIFDEFDVFGLSLRTEAWKDEWGVIFDGMWTDLDGDFGPSDSIGVTIHEGMVDLLGGYRIKADCLNRQNLIIDVMPGLRYHYLKQEIKISLPIPIPTQGGSEDWIEPVIGARVAWPFAKKWTLMVRGDMGGFGIGSASDLTWSIHGGIGFQFAEKWMLKLGYRYFDIDYSKGSGSREFGLDGSLDGIWLGLTWAP
jgi:hypothetical protein